MMSFFYRHYTVAIHWLHLFFIFINVIMSSGAYLHAVIGVKLKAPRFTANSFCLKALIVTVHSFSACPFNITISLTHLIPNQLSVFTLDHFHSFPARSSIVLSTLQRFSLSCLVFPSCPAPSDSLQFYIHPLNEQYTEYISISAMFL